MAGVASIVWLSKGGIIIIAIIIDLFQFGLKYVAHKRQLLND